MKLTNNALIDKELWDSAKWKDTAFLLPADGDGQAGIGLMFENMDAALEIFKKWNEVLGQSDSKDLLRVSIVSGEHPSKKISGYTVHFTTNPDSLIADGPDNYSVVTCRYKFKQTNGSNDSLTGFEKAFNDTKMYFITPIDAKNPVVDTSICLGKTSIYFRDFSEVSSDDIDRVTLE